MEELGNAIILSPFATYPLDVGQRKRAFQTTSLLRDWGFSITFLHFAFETRWHWGHNSKDDAVLKEQWGGDVLHFYANNKIGQPPVNGECHELDEWWDEVLGSYINNIFSKRQYDLCVIHNIWLSKAFDYVPYHCLKVLDMHDLFSQRAKEFQATGITPEFFHCSEKDEVFGLKRADVAVAIKQEDAEWCKARELGKTRVMTIPYVERLSSYQAETCLSTDVETLHRGKVVFGMIGSDIHFNCYAVKALLKELEIIIRETYAPIEFVLAGSICQSVGECPAFVKKLGFVNQVSDFYAAVDIIMVPMLHGTGVKIKSVEALNYCKPVLFTAHSAEGTGFKGRVCYTLSEMAHWAAEIALAAILPLELLNECHASLARARMWLEEAKQEFLAYYARKRPSFLQFLGSGMTPETQVLLEAFAGLSLYKELSHAFRVQGICIQPIISQYIQSVPSQPLAEIQSMRKAADVWSRSSFVIIPFSQRELLKKLSSCDGPQLILLDCRLASIDSLYCARLVDYSPQQNVICLLTPMQISLLNSSLGIETIAFPLLSERSTWDPHLRPLHAEIGIRRRQISARIRLEISSHFQGLQCTGAGASDELIFPYDSTACIREAVDEINHLCLNSLANDSGGF
jgi:hypothetical protein